MRADSNGKSLLRRIDRFIDRLAVCLSWISVFCIVIMGVLAVVDVIMAKTVGSGISIQKEIIESFMVPVFILFVANIQLTGGLMSVDIFSKHYGEVMKKAVNTITCVLGTVIMSYAGHRVFILFQDYLRKQTRASSYMLNSIKIWPFALILSIGLFSLAFAYLWTIVRIYWLPEVLEPDAGHIPPEIQAEIEDIEDWQSKNREGGSMS